MTSDRLPQTDVHQRVAEMGYESLADILFNQALTKFNRLNLRSQSLLPGRTGEPTGAIAVARATPLKKVDNLTVVDQRRRTGSFVLEYDTVLPLTKESSDMAMLELNELIIRSLNACAIAQIQQYIARDIEITSTDPIYKKVVVTADGKLRYGDTTSDIGSEITRLFGVPRLGEELSLPNFLRRIDQRYKKLVPATASSTSTDPYERLNDETKATTRLGISVIHLIASKRHLMEEHAKSDPSPTIYERSQYPMLPGDPGWGINQDYITTFLLGSSGAYNGYAPVTTIWPGGEQEPLRYYLDAFRRILVGQFMAGDLLRQLEHYRQQGVINHNTNPVYLIITQPFRANITLYGRINDQGDPFLGIRIAFGNDATQGTAQDPAKSNLEKGFDYSKSPRD